MKSMTLELIIVATALISLCSVVGIFIINLKKSMTNELFFILIAFATGTLLGAAFLDLLPEALEMAEASRVLLYALAGMMIFYVIEKTIHWHHGQHGGKQAEHNHKPVAYVVLVGDGLHNFFDGIAIAASFLTNIELGITTTIAVIAHEIPQEIGDYSLLIYSGFSKAKALLFNFISALAAVAGAVGFYYFAGIFENLQVIGLSVTAGAFIYATGVDLLPELHKEMSAKKSVIQLFAILIGIGLIWLVATYLE